jgi:type I restriction enzyme S subunit
MIPTSYESWKRATLRQVATIERRALSPSGIKDGTMYVGLEHLDSSGGFVDVRSVQSGDLASTKFQFTPDHILFGKLRPYLAKISRPAFSGVCSTDILPIKPGPSIDKDFLYYYLRQPQTVELATAQCSGANLPRLSPRHLAEFEIPLPPLSDQKRIAAILDQADAIRRKRQRAVEVTGELIPAIFDERFCPRRAGDGHVVTDLGECAEIVSGVTKGRQFNGQATLMLPYLRVANVQDGRLDLSEIKTVESLPSDLEKLRLQPGDVLLTEGGDYDKLGRGALWEGQVENCIHQNHIFRVRVDRQLLLPMFFATYLQTDFAKAYFLRCAKKTTNLATINMRQLRALPVPLAPIREQQEFVVAVDVLSGLSKSCAAACSESDQIFQALVQQAFRGEL